MLKRLASCGLWPLQRLGLGCLLSAAPLTCILRFGFGGFRSRLRRSRPSEAHIRMKYPAISSHKYGYIRGHHATISGNA
jgi:hypothetical protein